MGLTSATEARLKKYNVLTLVFEDKNKLTVATDAPHYTSTYEAIPEHPLYGLRVWVPPHYTSALEVVLKPEMHMTYVRKRRGSS